MKEEKVETIKRSIRIPKDINEELRGEARRRGKSVNRIILEILRRGVWDRGKGSETREKVELNYSTSIQITFKWLPVRAGKEELKKWKKITIMSN